MAMIHNQLVFFGTYMVALIELITHARRRKTQTHGFTVENREVCTPERIAQRFTVNCFCLFLNLSILVWLGPISLVQPRHHFAHFPENKTGTKKTRHPRIALRKNGNLFPSCLDLQASYHHDQRVKITICIISFPVSSKPFELVCPLIVYKVYLCPIICKSLSFILPRSIFLGKGPET